MQNVHIANTIKKLCKIKKVSIKDFQEVCDLSKSFIYDLEKRSASPSCAKISKIADYFNCSVDYLLGRTNIIEINRDNNDNREIIELSKRTKSVILPLYETAASAGTGNYLLDDTPVQYVTIEKNEKTQKADFLVKVNGDSMIPKFNDGDVVLVQQSSIITLGSIGIFGLNGESYIKKMGKGELISLNPAYPPIKLNDYDDARCFGKVICTIELQ
jgi:phage repressor protein C with HTH and peptisase S24 domain